MTLLTIQAVAQQLGLRPKTIRQYIRKGTLKGVKIGRVWRVDAEDLQVFVASRRT